MRLKAPEGIKNNPSGTFLPEDVPRWAVSCPLSFLVCCCPNMMVYRMGSTGYGGEGMLWDGCILLQQDVFIVELYLAAKGEIYDCVVVSDRPK